MNSSASEKGFVLPVAIGVGLIAILLGIMVVARSSQNRITATAQRETARSLAAAETGITQFQSLFDRYRPLATYCSSVATTPACNLTTKKWKDIASTDLAPDGICDLSAVDQVRSYDSTAVDAWKGIGADPKDGQYKLVSYGFSNADAAGKRLGTGTLIVDGRVNANDDGSNSSRTSTTRLKVEFKVDNGNDAAGTLPGLWIKNEAGSSPASGSLSTNIRSSVCPPVSPSPPPVSPFQNAPSAGYRYEAAPGEPFPVLPQNGVSPERFGTPTASLSAINGAMTFKPVAGSDRFAYQVVKSGDLSINLGTGNSLVFEDLPSLEGKPPVNITYVLYLEGGISLGAGSQIKVAPNSKLIMYVHGPVTLPGAAVQAADPSKAQIYVYPDTSASPAIGPDVNISGTASPMNLALLAPYSKVQMTGAQISGLVWAKSWIGSGGANITQSGLTASALDGVTFLPRITPITSWQRQPVN